MKRIFFFIFVIFLGSCEPRQGKSVDEVPSKPSEMKETNKRKIVVQEVLQANSYTYVKALEGSESIWIAIPKREVEVGEVYYYEQGMEMKDFKSKDLDRTFESIYFINGISAQPKISSLKDEQTLDDEAHKKKDPVQKQELNIQKEEGVTSIGDLYEHKTDFENKTIKVKGLVTKFNPSIMKKNWVHIQDGTGGDDSFDLVITTKDFVKVGEIATFQGSIAINKDFGYGYKYDLMMEEGIQLNKKSDMKAN